MPRAGLTPEAVVDTAINILDAEGVGAVTLAAVASRVGVAAPSLYKHVRNLDALRRLIAIRIFHELADRLTEVVMGRSRDEALRELLLAYRRYAIEFPHRYAALPQAPSNDPELAAAGERVVEVIFAVLRGYRLEGEQLVHAARCVRAAAHGFASLETLGGFGRPESVDASFDTLIRILTDGLGKGTD